MTFISCTPQQDEVFEQSASMRIEKSINEVKTILTSNTNGWLFQYYPGDKQEYGGYNMILRFTADGNVIVNNLKVKNGADCTSQFTIKQYGGVLLSFDTYNEAMHFFSDPINPNNEGAGIGKGLEGDFEFVVLNSSADKLEIRGIKTKGVCTLLPLADGVVPATLLNQLSTMEGNIAAPSYELYFNGEKVNGFSGNGKTFTFPKQFDAADSETETVSVIATETGMQLNKAISLKENEEAVIQHFNFDAANEKFVCTDEGQDLYIKLIFPPLNVVFATTENQWFFDVSFADPAAPKTDGMSATMAAKFTAANAAEKAGYNGFLRLAYLGRNAANKPGGDTNKWSFNFYSTESDGTWLSIFGYTPTAVDGTEDQITFTDKKLGKNASFYGWYATNIVDFIMSKTWKLTTDNKANPTKIRFEDTSDANNWFEVKK